MDVQRLLNPTRNAIDASGIRRVFELARSVKDPLNCSIGQPDFPVPDPIKDAAVAAIRNDHNGYTLTTGLPELRHRIARHLADDVGWDDPSIIVTAGTSGALTLACLALLGPGDECIIPDPWFVAYPALITCAGATPVPCDTYPDFALTADRVEPLITPRTRAVILNSPSNPAGAVCSTAQVRDLLDLCSRRNILLISDEIYDLFTYDDAPLEHAARSHTPRCPSPARAPGAQDNLLLIRGFGKSYGVTGWRLGFAAGPPPLIDLMARIQQFSFVCAPSIAQHAAIAALDTDVAHLVRDYQTRRDLVVSRLSHLTDLVTPHGAFYAFPRVPRRLGLTATQFVQRAIERSLLIIPGSVFSSRDTHFRLSYAIHPDTLSKALDVLEDLLR